ncbi:MAG: hypothetical protein ACW98Y_15385 [Candidatus Thorarchaeota archaeon]
MRKRYSRMLAVGISLCLALSLISVGAFYMVGLATGCDVPPEDVCPPDDPVECFEEICRPQDGNTPNDGCYGHRCGIDDIPR